jgi:hypothetical protein
MASSSTTRTRSTCLPLGDDDDDFFIGRCGDGAMASGEAVVGGALLAPPVDAFAVATAEASVLPTPGAVNCCCRYDNVLDGPLGRGDVRLGACGALP